MTAIRLRRRTGLPLLWRVCLNAIRMGWYFGRRFGPYTGWIIFVGMWCGADPLHHLWPLWRLQILVEPGCKIPIGFGWAYTDYARDYRVAYPVPINLMVRWARNFWWAIAWNTCQSRWDRQLRAAYLRGRQDGYHEYLKELRLKWEEVTTKGMR